jgi:hypothetical protein
MSDRLLDESITCEMQIGIFPNVGTLLVANEISPSPYDFANVGTENHLLHSYARFSYKLLSIFTINQRKYYMVLLLHNFVSIGC